MRKKTIFLAALLTVMILLFGCAMPALPAMPWDAPKPVNPPDVVPKDITPGQNQTPSELANETQAPPEEYNETYNQTEPEPIDPFANMTARNVSDKIYDGQFRLSDQSAYPLRIYVINGGLADSILVNRGEFNMLLDSGNFDATDAFLKSANVKKLNVLVATRDYQGAVAGIDSLLDKYPVEELWENGVATSGSLADTLAKARGMGTVIKHPQAGDKWNFSGVEFAVLNPPRQRLLGNPDIDSIVLKVSMGRFCTLFLNPTVQERENALLSSGESPKCEVVTYFKHGEGRPEPSVLMSNIGPKDVIISVGPNDLGLPRATTLTRLNLSGVRIWRTDERGTIRITNDGFSPYEIAGLRNITKGNWTNYFGASVN